MDGRLCGCDIDCDCDDPCPTVEEQVEEWPMLAADDEYPLPTRCEICQRKRHVLDTEFVQAVRGTVHRQRVEVCRACLVNHLPPFSFLLACWLTMTCFARCSVLCGYHHFRGRLSYRLSKLKRAAHGGAATYIRMVLTLLFRRLEKLLSNPLDGDDFLLRFDLESKGLHAAIADRMRRLARKLEREVRYKTGQFKRGFDWRLGRIWTYLRYGHILLPLFPLGLFFRIFRVLYQLSKRVAVCSWRKHQWTDPDGAPLHRCLTCLKRQRLFPLTVYARNIIRAFLSRRRKKLLVRLFTIYVMKDERRWELAWAHSVIKRTPENFEQAFKVRAAHLLKASDLRRLETFAREKGHARIAEIIRAQLNTNG